MRIVDASKPAVVVHSRCLHVASHNWRRFLFELIRPTATGCLVSKACYHELKYLLAAAHFITFDLKREATEHYRLALYLLPKALYLSTGSSAK